MEWILSLFPIWPSVFQKGTGKWTAISALEYGIPLTLIGINDLYYYSNGPMVQHYWHDLTISNTSCLFITMDCKLGDSELCHMSCPGSGSCQSISWCVCESYVALNTHFDVACCTCDVTPCGITLWRPKAFTSHLPILYDEWSTCHLYNDL